MYWSKQSFTGLGPEDRCSSWGLIWNGLLRTSYIQYRIMWLSDFSSRTWKLIFFKQWKKSKAKTKIIWQQLERQKWHDPKTNVFVSFIGETITLRSDRVMDIGEYMIHLSCYDDTDYGTSNVTFIIYRNITAVGDHEGKVLSIMSQLNAPIFPNPEG